MTVQITENTISKEIKGLKAAGPKVVRALVQSLTRETHRNAVRGIQRGPASGRLYQKYNPRRTHRASAPGEYPASDTGRLASSIQFELPTNSTNPVGIVGTNLQYGKHLELKPAVRGGRPWLMPAFNQATAKAEDMLARIFKRMNKKGGK